jgi:acyl transferase domain-containing protein/thioesterase domain-containing protein
MKNSGIMAADPSAIAITGMAARFPGARSLEQFWENLRDGVESIRPLTDAQLLAAGVDPSLLKDPDYVKFASVLDGIDLFDAAFFGLSPKDAAIMDPQHRALLECAWTALESAGWSAETFPGRIGVYAGSGMNAYLIYNLLPNRRLMDSAGMFLIKQTGNDKDVLATRISYQLNLTGPSMTVQTACSTALVAVHLACQSLLLQECDMALAGGVSIDLPHGAGYLYRPGEILSRDGHCRAFDAAATGTVFGSGAGLVALRRLKDALEDRDVIHAVIRGTAINNDGSRKVGYLAPSVAGQADVITEALAMAGVPAESISYIETHGTGTQVGDPIEVAALTQAFRRATQKRGFCRIGSVKSNIGHLDAAAGIAGLIKTVLALKHRQIPPSLHFETPNPEIIFSESPFVVNSRLCEWPDGDGPRRAGVTSLGIGGTNAHVVVEEAPQPRDSGPSRAWQVLTLSARSESALDALAGNVADYLADHAGLNLADAAYTCHVGRKPFPHRRAAVCRDAEEAVKLLRSGGAASVFNAVTAKGNGLAFLFPGQGSQYPNMTRRLYEQEPAFREEVDRSALLLEPLLGRDLRAPLFPDAAGIEAAESELAQTSLTQPALFVVEYALAKLWMSWGIHPDATIGHSLGEYVSACLAGVLSLEEALFAVAHRGRLMQSAPGGAMLALPLSEAEAGAYLTDAVSLAAINGPRQTVISGPPDQITALERTLSERGIEAQRLRTSHAFHSQSMDSILEPFARVMEQVSLHPPAIPFVSNTTGAWITAREATDPQYWVRHLRRTVRFSEGLGRLFEGSTGILLEVGPGRALSALAHENPARSEAHRIVASLPGRRGATDDVEAVMRAVAQIWVAGRGVDWKAFHDNEVRNRVSIPTYPFERKRFWIDAPPDAASSAGAQLRNGETAPSPAGAQAGPGPLWYYHPVWKRSQTRPESESPAEASARWLVFLDGGGIGEEIARQLKRRGSAVLTVTPASRFARTGPQAYTLASDHRPDYDLLIADLIKSGGVPKRVVHLWAMGERNEALARGSFDSLLFLAQAIGTHEVTREVELNVISDGMQKVQSEAAPHPEAAVVLGPVRVIPKEFANIRTRSIDALPGGPEAIARQLISEMSTPPEEQVVAYRGFQRWAQTLERVELSAPGGQTLLRPRGVYIITGGLGGLGLAVAECLARSMQARVVLMGRTGLPPRSEWARIKLAAGEEETSERIRKIESMESSGAEVTVVSADVTDIAAVRGALAGIRARYGAIHGVIHAAGVLEDGLIQLKTTESAHRVLAPKLQGTLALDGALGDQELDFFVLFSSVSSYLAPVGQVDYVAANSFLSAFAAASGRRRVIAIDWAKWRGPGMGSPRRPASGVPAARDAAPAHPLLETLQASGGDWVYRTRLTDELWLLREHRLRNGDGLFPGTGYLEVVAAAMISRFGPGAVEVRELSFLAPLRARTGQSKTVDFRFSRESGFYRFSAALSGAGSGSPQLTYCAGGSVRHLGTIDAPAVDLREWFGRCARRTIDPGPAGLNSKQARHIDFGPRWRCLKTVRLGEGEAVCSLELSAEFAPDLDAYRFHPALLDAAAGAAMYAIPDYDLTEDLYVPVSYGRVVLYSPLPAKCHCHIRGRESNHVRNDAVTFDLIVADEQGRVIAAAEGFVLRRLSGPSALSLESAKGGVRSSVPPEVMDLDPAAALEAFAAILRDPPPPELVVCPAGMVLDEAPKPPAQSHASSPAPAQPAAGGNGARRDSLEGTLIGWWEELLGVTGIGAQDDFFDLGGHSLLGVRLLTRIEREWKRSVPLHILFEARTVEKLAAYIRAAGGEAPKSIVPMNTRGEGPMFYCVHSLGGDVASFRHLIAGLGSSVNFSGIQKPTDAGDFSIESLAALYVKELLAADPRGPYVLGGWSAGSVIAFEMARQLNAAGKEVELIVALDGGPYNTGATTRPWSPAYYWKLLRNLPLWIADDLLKDRSAKKLLRRVWNKGLSAARRLQGGSRRLEADVSSFLDISDYSARDIDFMNQLFGALRRYVPAWYGGRVVVYQARTEPLHHLFEIDRAWRSVSAGVDVVRVPGTHLSLILDPYVRIIAEDLRPRLEALHPVQSGLSTRPRRGVSAESAR